MFDPMLQLVQQINASHPLILNLTNYVTMEWVANGLLSLSASPIMTESIEEIDELVAMASSVVINIGTLEKTFVQRATLACASANNLKKPLVLDPVGAGASHYRTQTCLDLLEQFQFTSIRGNAGEIMALAGLVGKTKGVDAEVSTSNALESAQQLSTRYQTTIAISGKTDFIVTQLQTEALNRGSPLMTRVTGTGCLLTAVVGAFHAVCQDAHCATRSALLFYSVCGEKAASMSNGPGSFQSHFLDALSSHPLRHDYA